MGRLMIFFYASCSGSIKSLLATKLISAFIFFPARITDCPTLPNPFMTTLMSDTMKPPKIHCLSSDKYTSNFIFSDYF